MTRLSTLGGTVLLLALGLVGLAVSAGLGERTASAAQPRSLATVSSTLAGTVVGTTVDREPMHGVAVSARAIGATVTTTVFTDEQGEYFFPTLDKGEYRAWAQAVGYETAHASVLLDGVRPARQAFALTSAPPSIITAQLTASEWLAALPTGTWEERRLKALLEVNCTTCHSVAMPLQSRFDEAGWLAIIDLMLGSGLNTSATQDKYSTIYFHREELARYLSTVRGPNSPELVFTLLPRPTGDAARVVITEYDIPIANQAAGLAWANGSDWSKGQAMGGDRGNPIHSMVIDNNGDAWITAHISAKSWGTMVRLNPRTAQVTGFKLRGPDGAVMGNHSLGRDMSGTIWFPSQPALVRLDPSTEAFQAFVPPPNMGERVQYFVDADAKGKVWASTAYGVIRFDPDMKTWMYFQNVVAGDGFTYDVAGDAEGNGWWVQHQTERIGRGDPSTGRSHEVLMRPPWKDDEEDVSTAADREFYDSMGALRWGKISLVPGAQMPRRIGADQAGDSVWVANFLGNNLARINIDTLETKYYRLPTKGNPYKAIVDRHHNAWTTTMGDDQVLKLNPETGQWTIYWLPTKGCQPRDIAVDDGRDEIWVPCREGARVNRLQFRTAAQLQALKAGAAR